MWCVVFAQLNVIEYFATVAKPIVALVYVVVWLFHPKLTKNVTHGIIIIMNSTII